MPPRGRRTELDKQYDFRQGSELTRELGEEAAKRLDAAYKINKRDKLRNDLRSGLSCWHMQVMDNKIMDERASPTKRSRTRRRQKTSRSSPAPTNEAKDEVEIRRKRENSIKRRR